MTLYNHLEAYAQGFCRAWAIASYLTYRIVGKPTLDAVCRGDIYSTRYHSTEYTFKEQG